MTTASFESTKVKISSSAAAFPSKLHFMLNEMNREGLEHIACWQENGISFIVNDRSAMEKTIIPCYFQQSKFSSFQRQLNIYSFRRITKGKYKGGYFHEFFQRERIDLTFKIQRVGDKKKLNPPPKPYDIDVIVDRNQKLLPSLPNIHQSFPELYELRSHSLEQTPHSSLLARKAMVKPRSDQIVLRDLEKSKPLSIFMNSNQNECPETLVSRQIGAVHRSLQFRQESTIPSSPDHESNIQSVLPYSSAVDSHSFRSCESNGLHPFFLETNIDAVISNYLYLLRLQRSWINNNKISYDEPTNDESNELSL